jgi:hydrogenase-4 component F
MPDGNHVSFMLLAAPLFAATISLFIKNIRMLHGLNVMTMLMLVVGDLVLWAILGRQESFTALGDLVFVDNLSVFILSIVVVIGLSCSIYLWSYFDDEAITQSVSPRRLRTFFPLYHVFLFAMIAATLANSLGVQWVAVEATTLATVFLITFFKSRESLEAGWKYLILCSVGIALALFGTVLTYYSSIRVLGEEHAALNLTSLLPVAAQMDGHVLKLAFIFILVGYGTKIGLVPMHTWLPEAYSEAPAPVTAMLAGVLETVAVYAVLRSKSIVDQAVSPGFTGNLLILIGLISFGTAALFILIQRDYKRLFAYSSIEHMGLAMVGFGVGGQLGTFAGLWHLLNHALAKSLGFFAVGNIFQRYRTRQIHEVQGMAKVQPITAIAFLAGGLALVGMPPFSLFNSELLVITSLAQMTFQFDSFHLGRFLTITVSHEIRSLGIIMMIVLLAVALFGGFIYRLTGMVWGTPPAGVRQGEAWHIGQLPLAVSAFALVWMGFHLPAPVETLLQRATDVVMGR